jgi:hypothetical protein
MKNLIWLLLIAALALTACQPQPAPAPAPIEVQPIPDGDLSYPPPPTPFPGQFPTPVSVGAYPEPGEGAGLSVLPWNEAAEIVLSGQVNAIRQTQAGEIYLELRDGRTLQTSPPQENDLRALLDQCGALCAGIVIIEN